MPMKFKPTYNRILLKLNDDSGSRNIGGIEIPDTVQSLKVAKCRQATILAAGVPDKTKYTEVIQGQQVIIGQYCGVEVEIEKEKLLVVTYDDIIMTESK